MKVSNLREDLLSISSNLVQTWIRYKAYVSAICKLFSYLDRFYVLHASKPCISDMAYEIFREKLFVEYRSELFERFLRMLDDKRAESDVDEFELDGLSQLFNLFDDVEYRDNPTDLESEIILRANTYYSSMASIWINDCNLTDYVSIVEHCLEQEEHDCIRWLSKSTVAPLRSCIYDSLVKSHQQELISKLDEFTCVLRDGTRDDLKLIYDMLYTLEGSFCIMADSIRSHIQQMQESLGTVDDIMQYWLKYKELCDYCFSSNIDPRSGQLNTETAVPSQQNDGTDATTENTAPKGDSCGPNFAISNAIRMAFKGIICTRQDFIKDFVNYWDMVIISGEDIHNRLRHCCEILDLVDRRMQFYQCYKFKLARRLLYELSSLQNEHHSFSLIESRIASDDAACLRRMIKEACTNRENPAYPNIQLYSKCSWPALRDYPESFNLYNMFETSIQSFKQSQNSSINMDVTVNRMLSRVKLELDTPEGTKTLLCDLVQASALLMFNSNSMRIDAVATGLGTSKESTRTILQPLLDKQVLRLLEGDMIELNTDFSDGTDVTVEAVPTYHISNTAPTIGFEMDANAAIDSNIMSILKSVKSVKRADLLLQLSHLSENIVLDRIYNLAEREYLSVSDGMVTYLP
uniref:Uncharacterized protein n=1 Tax=Babesia bovis TaxID=5865 RepID=A7ANW5_BABBO|eukprot:XP_001611817.1 hypothetical protein [Babesia bovis T2Bo]